MSELAQLQSSATEAEDWRHAGFGLYIHWPFCAAKCPYCDFNSHVASEISQRAWRNAYLAELRRGAVLVPDRIVNSVFFGGGTPSLMDPDTVADILAEIRRLWPHANDLEVTLEANPSSVEADRFRAFQDAGVSRISIGIQSLNDRSLQRLGRLHTATEARAAFDIARKTFARVSFDLIYARQDQSLEEWRSELQDALEMAADHLSLYQLTVEPGTAFAARHDKGGLPGLPDDTLAADLYSLTQDCCAAAGLPAYEVSNHAFPGAESRHNLIYWRGGDWLGIGPGAHGRLTLPCGRTATTAIRSPSAWLHAVQTRGSGDTEIERLSSTEHAEEYLMMSLRLSEGTDLGRLSRLGLHLNPSKIDDLTEMDLVQSIAANLRTTAKGRLVLNAVLRDLLTG
ncbi:MAG: radical SAM family heme chaperone HemW [Pseudomonadota bacterium]